MATITPTHTLRPLPSTDSSHDPRGVWEFAVPLDEEEVGAIFNYVETHVLYITAFCNIQSSARVFGQ
jgi:hypothetical protein